MNARNAALNARTVTQKARLAARASPFTYLQIGIKMGYPADSARQSVSQFLNSTNPTVAMLLRFAEALNLDPRGLL